MIKQLLIGLCCAHSIAHAQPSKLYITLISHNEDNIGYDNSSSLYYNNRAVLVNICNILQAEGVKYNYGADYVALQAIEDLDTGSVVSTTNGKNLVRWMKEDKGVECDPHAHETTYNYADVHYLMSQLGIIPSDVMSGYLYDTLQNGVAWDSYQNGVTGIIFPSHSWQPKILWGGATPMHVADPHFFGVFKPQSTINFFEHNPSNTLTAIGVGCPIKLESTTTISYVDSLIDKIVSDIQSAALPPGGIYTQEIFFGEGKVNQPWFLPLLNKVIDSVNVHVGNGTAEWKNLTEIHSLWQTAYDSIPFAYDCGGYDVLGVNANDPVYDGLSIYPNPFSEEVIIRTNSSLHNAGLTVYNSFGQTVSQIKNLSGQSITFRRDQLRAGLYFFRLTENNAVITTGKLIITD
jgi:hypothetical protein